MELSCLRFELEDLENCRIIGKANENNAYDRVFFGLACTEVCQIKKLNNYSLFFTPIISNMPKNYFHTDIYDDLIISGEIGVANSAEVNLRKEELRKIWEPYKDDQGLLKESVQPLVVN